MRFQWSAQARLDITSWLWIYINAPLVASKTCQCLDGWIMQLLLILSIHPSIRLAYVTLKCPARGCSSSRATWTCEACGVKMSFKLSGANRKHMVLKPLQRSTIIIISLHVTGCKLKLIIMLVLYMHFAAHCIMCNYLHAHCSTFFLKAIRSTSSL